jgi:16S rRNA processing protein RimM
MISSMKSEKKILVGKIAAAQGLRGEFRVQTFTERPDDLARFTICNSQSAIRFVRAAGPNVAICKMDGVSDRDAAEKLRGAELFINRSDLPPLKKGEHYIADLIGMKVISRGGRRTLASAKRSEDGTDDGARVVDVHNFGAGDILELDNGQMISFNGAAVDYKKKEIKYEK